MTSEAPGRGAGPSFRLVGQRCKTLVGWTGNGLDNKPFITVDPAGTVSVTDPELCRVISFSASTGKATRVWDGCAAGSAFQLPSGILSDGSGGLWVTDATNGKLVHFQTQAP